MIGRDAEADEAEGHGQSLEQVNLNVIDGFEQRFGGVKPAGATADDGDAQSAIERRRAVWLVRFFPLTSVNRPGMLVSHYKSQSSVCVLKTKLVIMHIMSIDQPIVFATSNPHKTHEVGGILKPLGISVHTLDADAQKLPEPEENGVTFPANALIKARYYARHTGRLVMADDSGLVVDALDGKPGVLSARYAGVQGGRDVVDPANNAKLIEAIRTIPEKQRTARFVCVMALCAPDRTLAIARGVVEGLILTEPRGTNGFGYDPLFLLPERGCTTAELSDEQKNAISHRGQATRRLSEMLTRIL
jgi:XTP/dITP diphosphohydrolase